jgi:3-deoxy-manno-octulosonate cytidylyltransferase (CMP-KDO synthetase)
MTGPNHPSGTDRIAEVAQNCRCDAIVNIQGDEPLIDPRVIDAVAGALAKEEMSTAATLIEKEAEWENPNVVKVVVNARAVLYISPGAPFRMSATPPRAQSSWRRFRF